MNKMIILLGLTSLNVLASNYSIGEPITIWKKKEIKVCFADKNNWPNSRISRSNGFGIIPKHNEGLAFTSEQRELIENIVTQNYSKLETGIHFTGWKNCNEDTNADVYIFRMEKDGSLLGKANIGQDSDYKKTAEGFRFIRNPRTVGKEFVLLNTFVKPQTATASDKTRRDKTKAEEHFQMTVLHEFGHIAGLRHEHARVEEAKEDKNCQTTYKNLDDLKEVEALTTEQFGVYDPNSIMSYCFLRKINRQVGLSFKVNDAGVLPLNLTDETIYTKTLVNKSPKIYEYNIKISLSAMDKHSLRCMYKYDEDEKSEKCHPAFSL